MIGIDANVLVYAADESAPEHLRCRALLLGTAPSPRPGASLFTTWSVVYEFLRVVTHPKVLRRPWSNAEAWRFVSHLMDAELVTVLGPGPRHSVAAEQMLSAPGIRGNLVHDAHIAAVLAEHGIRRIYTRDQDFRRFPGMEVVDPLG